MNAFQKYPQFIETDIRINRYFPAGYNVNYKLMLERHQALLPESLIKGKSVLDLGCCVGATGAWALDLGAKNYTGVEMQKNFAEQAVQNLTQVFPHDRWEILEISIEQFFKTNTRKFDIVYAGGIIYSDLYYQDFVRNIAELANEAVVVESRIPSSLKTYPTMLNQTADFVPIVEYIDDYAMVHEDQSNLKIRCAIPSLGAIEMLLEDQGFGIDADSYHKLKTSNLQEGINLHRFGAIFNKKYLPSRRTAETEYNNKTIPTADWKNLIQKDREWRFHRDVAKNFVFHARKHIPDYDKVIDLSVNLCEQMTDGTGARIIDVGCATGETLFRLRQHGFYNLVGVDNSQAMIDECKPDQATYILSDSFPLDQAPFDVVISNWTLHFIKDKNKYLQEIYQGLKPGGVLILTDKTSNDFVDLKMYHNFKRGNGVSDEEILAKALSIKDIMFIDPVEWYLDTLKNTGFSRTTIVNAAPCFTTFLVVK